MNNLRNGRLESEITAIAVHAYIVGKALGVAAETKGVIRLIKVSDAQNQFGLIVALEAGARHNVEYAISSIAKFRAVAAAINLHVVDVFGIKLRSNVGGDVGVGNGHAIDQPAASDVHRGYEVDRALRTPRARNP